ncbi:hypothetical protein SBA2_70032 [Acidobacteriia bacterium SbA2]|nr:hypothetical protein SBA2_70032 [Acidobacteriia bacterium SbA2]
MELPGSFASLRMTGADSFTGSEPLGYFTAPLAGLLTRGRIGSTCLANY